MNRVLVTGAAGFIGSHLVDRLLADGGIVVGLDNFDDFYDPALKRGNISAAFGNKRFTLVEGDILDKPLLEELFRAHEIEIVVHLAARAGVRPSINNPELYYRVNVTGTLTLLEAMRNAGLRRMVFGSSSSVYGSRGDVPFRESDNADRPVSPYAATKRACELMCHAWHHLFEMDAACLRFFTVYGPRQRPDMAIDIFTRLIDRGEAVPLFGGSESRRDYTYVDDIVQGITGAMKQVSEAGGFRIYNLGESAVTGLAELVEIIGRALGRDVRTRMEPAMAGDVPVTFADVSLAKKELGYAPSVSVKEGIRRYVKWYRERGG